MGIIISIAIAFVILFFLFAPTKVDSGILNFIGNGIQAAWRVVKNFVVGIFSFFKKG